MKQYFIVHYDSYDARGFEEMLGGESDSIDELIEIAKTWDSGSFDIIDKESMAVVKTGNFSFKRIRDYTEEEIESFNVRYAGSGGYMPDGIYEEFWNIQ